MTSVAINCATNRYMIGGTISGLAGTVTLQNNGGDDLDVTSNGTFAFPTSVLSGATYDVTVKAQPTTPSQTCTVANGTGTVDGGNVTSVAVTCTTNVFTIGGTVSGLAAGDSITLRNNGGDAQVRSANGGFTFATPVASGQPYAVTVVSPTSPIAQTCTVANGTGTVGTGNVTSVAVTCTGTPPSSGSFSYSATDTNSATQNTSNFNISIAAGQILTIGTCGVPGSSGVGDTYLRLFDASSTEVAANDDACGGFLTNFTFTATTTGTFQVRAGCFTNLSCSGTVAYTLSGT